MTRAHWTYRAYCDRRALIAERLGIPAADVSIDQTLSYDAGEMEPMEACDWPRLPDASISSGPYVVPLARSREPYTVSPTRYAAVGAPFPDDAQWPSPLPSLITEGSGGNG